jgi:hypothetical protein
MVVMRMRTLPALALALACLLARGPVRAQEAAPGAGSLESARETLARWVETQKIISREKKDWQQAKELLVSRIEVLKKETSTLEEKLQQARAELGTSQKARSEQLAERDRIKGLTAGLALHAGELEVKVRGLVAGLPESLRERVMPLYQRIPPDPLTAKVSPAERYQNILGILNELNRLNSEITVVSEIRPLSDGRPSEVKSVYVGLGQAYFVSAGGEAGIGRPAEGGWKWTPANLLARDVNQVLEILQNKSSPRFVALPVDIR